MGNLTYFFFTGKSHRDHKARLCKDSLISSGNFHRIFDFYIGFDRNAISLSKKAIPIKLEKPLTISLESRIYLL